MLPTLSGRSVSAAEDNPADIAVPDGNPVVMPGALAGWDEQSRGRIMNWIRKATIKEIAMMLRAVIQRHVDVATVPESSLHRTRKHIFIGGEYGQTPIGCVERSRCVAARFRMFVGLSLP